MMMVCADKPMFHQKLILPSKTALLTAFLPVTEPNMTTHQGPDADRMGLERKIMHAVTHAFDKHTLMAISATELS